MTASTFLVDGGISGAYVDAALSAASGASCGPERGARERALRLSGRAGPPGVGTGSSGAVR